MNVQCAITYGEEPIGYAVGPNLEAREALKAVMGKGPRDLVNKAITLAGILLEMVGKENGKSVAYEVLRLGKAEKKLREIIEAQGGDPNVKPEDIPIGDKKVIIRSQKKGRVLWINNAAIAKIARAAGAPKDKGAGVRLFVKLGEYVREGDPLFEIRAEVGYKLQAAEEIVESLMPIGVGKLEEEMLITRIPWRPFERKNFVVER